MSLNKDILLILLSRVVRTFPYGILSIILPVYLANYGSFVLGLFFSLSAISSVTMLLIMTLLGNRIDMMKLIIVQTLLTATSLLILSFSTLAALVLFAATMSVSVWSPGGGSGSAGGPYSTSLTILLSERTTRQSRTLAFSLSSVGGSLAYAAGAFFLSTLKISNPKSPASSHLSVLGNSLNIIPDLFMLAAIAHIISILFFVPILKLGNNPTVLNSGVQVKEHSDIIKEEPKSYDNASPGDNIWKTIRQAFSFIVAELANGFGNGLYSQLAPLWFYIRFGISVGTVAEIFAISGVITTFFILLSPRIEKIIGLVNSVSLARAGYGVLLLLTAFAPTLIAALVFYYASLVFARFAAPVQQSLVFSKIEKKNWTRAASMITFSNLMGISIGPLLGSFLLLNVNVELPLIIAFPFIVASAIIYKSMA